MNIEEFKEELSNYMKEGEFIVNDVGNDRIHIIWTVHGNDYSQVIESKLMNMESKDFVEEVVKPTVAKFKAFNKRRLGISETNKESFREQLERSAEEHKATLEYLKDN